MTIHPQWNIRLAMLYRACLLAGILALGSIPSQSAANPTSDFKVLAVVATPHFNQSNTQLFTRFSPFLEIAMRQPNYQLAQALKPFFPAIGKSMSMHKAFQLLPELAVPFGFRPEGSFAMAIWESQGITQIGIILPVNESKLLSVLTLLGFSPSLKRKSRGQLLLIGKGPSQDFLGTLARGHLILPIFSPSSTKAQKAQVTKEFITQTLRWKSPIADLMEQTGQGSAWKEAKQKQHYMVMAIQNPTIHAQASQNSKHVLRSAYSYFTLKRGMQYVVELQGHPHYKSYISLFQPRSLIADWTDLLPASTGLLAQTTLHLPALFKVLPNLFQLHKDSNAIPREFRMFWSELLTKTQSLGLSQKLVLSNFTGQWMSGFLWPFSNGVVSFTGPMFQKHMNGLFAILGLQKTVRVDALMDELQRIIQNKMANQSIKLQSVIKHHYNGFPMLEIKDSPSSALYIAGHRNFLLLASTRHTIAQFARTWAKQKPSLAKRAQKDPILKQQLKAWGGQGSLLRRDLFIAIAKVATASHSSSIYSNAQEQSLLLQKALFQVLMRVPAFTTQLRFPTDQSVRFVVSLPLLEKLPSKKRKSVTSHHTAPSDIRLKDIAPPIILAYSALLPQVLPLIPIFSLQHAFALRLMGGFGEATQLPVSSKLYRFPIRVMALDTSNQGLQGAKVYVQDKLIGTTDKSGRFEGSFQGYPNKRVKIEVKGKGQNNYLFLRTRLKTRRTEKGIQPATVKIEAFLRPW